MKKQSNSCLFTVLLTSGIITTNVTIQKIRSVKLGKCINVIKLQQNYLLTVHMKQFHTTGTLSSDGLFQGVADYLHMPLPQIM